MVEPPPPSDDSLVDLTWRGVGGDTDLMAGGNHSLVIVMQICTTSRYVTCNALSRVGFVVRDIVPGTDSDVVLDEPEGKISLTLEVLNLFTSEDKPGTVYKHNYVTSSSN